MGDESAIRAVAAMQFAAGHTIEQVAREWERDAGWVEHAIRETLLARISERDGGTMPLRAQTRDAARAARLDEDENVRGMQSELFTSTCDSAEPHAA